MKNIHSACTSTDVLIIGGGVAGLSAALSLSPLSVMLVAPHVPSQEGSTYWAQGGISAATSKEDSPELHAKDTIAVGAGLCDTQVVHLMTRYAPQAIQWLSTMGVNFDRAEDESLILALEAAHSMRRVCHAGGDQIGKAITKALTRQLLQSSNINIAEGSIVSLLKDQNGEIAGAEISTSSGIQTVFAEYVILATGGIGGLFAHSTNPSTVKGEGLALAALAGAELIDLEFIQFHPTALNIGASRQKPLLTEALRGEGAEVINDKGEEFLYSLDSRGPLAPRALISRGIAQQLREGRNVFLDARKIAHKIPSYFPQVSDICASAGLNPSVDLLPIIPAAHYHMGGIKADIQGSTTIEKLYAIGEVACTGFHGANRLASNSLLEGVIMGRLCGKEIINHFLPRTSRRSYTSCSASLSEEHTITPDIFSNTLGIIRNGEEIHQTLNKIFRPSSLIGITQNLILQSALMRTESRGAHYREDYPDTLAKWEKRVSISLTNGLQTSIAYVPINNTSTAKKTNIPEEVQRL